MATEPLRVLEPRRREKKKKNGASGLLHRLLGSRTRRTALLVGFLLFTGLLFPREPDFEVLTLREGFPAKRDLIAPFQFYLLKERGRLRAEQTGAARLIPPVYSTDPAVQPGVRALLDSLATGEGRDRLAGTHGAKLRARLRDLGVSPPALRLLGAPEGKRIALLAERIADRAYADGLLADKESARLETDADGASVARENLRSHVPWESLHDLASVREEAWAEGIRAFPSRPEAARALQELVTAVIVPDLRYEASTTERQRAEARASIDPYEGLVRKDEKIIGSHEVATPLHIRKLESLRAWNARSRPVTAWRQDLLATSARLALISFLIAGFLGYLRRNHRTVYRDDNQLLLLAVLAAAVMGVGWVVVNQFRGHEMLIPMTVLSLSAALLFGQGVAFAATLVVSLVTGVVFGLGLPFLSGSAIAGLAAIATARGVRRRRDFYQPMLVVALASAFAIVAMGLVDGAVGAVLWRRALWGVVAGFASVLAVMTLLPLLESVFSVTTDVTLLELADLNRPILRRLMLEAPGTYHHSLVVGSLAEAGATTVGANPLVARVGAYYHDIGKIEKAEYYVENQSSARNRHEKLQPTMSCLIIEAHVREGAEIARKERLPAPIIDAIREHHGTTLMSYFYHKAVADAKRKAATSSKVATIEEADFRYPGPKPRSKETAILMLADAVEAAARSLTEPTPSRIRGVVTRILDARVEDGQLDQSPITFEDLAKIRESFIPILTALFHARVDYPGAHATAASPERAGRRDRGRVDREKSRLRIDHS